MILVSSWEQVRALMTSVPAHTGAHAELTLRSRQHAATVVQVLTYVIIIIIIIIVRALPCANYMLKTVGVISACKSSVQECHYLLLLCHRPHRAEALSDDARLTTSV